MRAIAALVVVALAACGGGDDEPSLTGVVIEIEGDLLEVEGFTLLTPEGERVVFATSTQIFGDGVPLSHLTDHLRSGEPVQVFYERDADGTRRAVRVDDAPA